MDTCEDALEVGSGGTNGGRNEIPSLGLEQEPFIYTDVQGKQLAGLLRGADDF